MSRSKSEEKLSNHGDHCEVLAEWKRVHGRLLASKRDVVDSTVATLHGEIWWFQQIGDQSFGRSFDGVEVEIEDIKFVVTEFLIA